MDVSAGVGTKVSVGVDDGGNVLVTVGARSVSKATTAVSNTAVSAFWVDIISWTCCSFWSCCSSDLESTAGKNQGDDQNGG